MESSQTQKLRAMQQSTELVTFTVCGSAWKCSQDSPTPAALTTISYLQVKEEEQTVEEPLVLPLIRVIAHVTGNIGNV